MKTKFTLFALLTLFTSLRSFSFNPEPVFESDWKGYSKQYTDLFEGGQAVLLHSMYDVNFDVNDYTFTGKMKSTIKIDGYTYQASINVKGTYNYSNFEVYIRPTSVISEDALPGDLYWIYSTIKATLYSDQENSNYYILKGYTLDLGGYNESSIEFSTDPYYYE